MTVLLCLDIGNTHVVIGGYRGTELAYHWRVQTDHDRTADEYAVLLLSLLDVAGLAPDEVSDVALCSVVPPLTATFVEIAKTYLGRTPLVVSADVDTGVKVRVDNPHEVGADRIANTAAVAHRYGGPACVVDFGTATTFDIVSREGDFLGGAIAPGLGIAADALVRRTAKLPRVALEPPPSPIGRNTVHAMQSGIIWGYVGLVEGLVARFRTELGPEMKVIATGGLARAMARLTPVIQHVDPWLTLEGIRLIYERNAHPPSPTSSI